MFYWKEKNRYSVFWFTSLGKRLLFWVCKHTQLLLWKPLCSPDFGDNGLLWLMLIFFFFCFVVWMTFIPSNAKENFNTTYLWRMYFYMFAIYLKIQMREWGGGFIFSRLVLGSGAKKQQAQSSPVLSVFWSIFKSMLFVIKHAYGVLRRHHKADGR